MVLIDPSPSVRLNAVAEIDPLADASTATTPRAPTCYGDSGPAAWAGWLTELQ